MRRIFRRSAVVLVCALVLLFVLFLSRASWLTALGSYLVHDDGPWKADVIVVLGGDERGRRVLKGAELAKQGFAPHVLLSGVGNLYGQHEADLAIALAVRRGYAAEMFLPFRYPARSTRDEAHAVAAELRRSGVHRFMLVTSNYHSHRASKIFREEAPNIPFHTVATPDGNFTPDGWWKSREGKKRFAEEWSKTVANWLGL